MDTTIIRQLNTIADDRFAAVAHELLAWLNRENEATVTESHAHEMLITSAAVDEPTINDFERVMMSGHTVRVGLYDLLDSADIPPATLEMFGSNNSSAPWLAVALSAFAWKTGYPIDELDPANLPPQFTPAGQVLHQTGQWVKRQVQRNATERDQLAKKLQYTTPPTPSLSEISEPSAPAGEIPVRHFEFNDEINLADEVVADDGRLKITEWDLQPTQQPTQQTNRQAVDIQITGESRAVARPANYRPNRQQQAQRQLTRAKDGLNQARRNLPEVVNRDGERTELRIPIPQQLIDGANKVSGAVRDQMASRQTSEARLKVQVLLHPNGGNGIPAVNVSVRYENSRKWISGTTNPNGQIQFALPVKSGGQGLTYVVMVTWPLEMGLKEEVKKVTLNAGRPEYVLPFYARVS